MPPVDEIPIDCYHHRHCDEETKESIPTSGHSNHTPSSAQVLVQAAAYRIDLNPSKLKILLQAMKEELVTEIWQLDYMDFTSWREMGFPVGLIASIRAVKEEEELEERENNLKKYMPHRSGGPSEYSSKLVASKASLHANKSIGEPNDNEHGRLKRQISDLTMSERCSFRRTVGIMLSPAPANAKFGNLYSPKSEHQTSERRIFPLERSAKSLSSDTPPIAAHRRRSSKTKTRDQPRRPTDYDPNQKQERRSSITMPACPARRPTFTDLESVAKEVDDPSDKESFAVGSLTTSKTSEENPNDDASLELESMMRTSQYGGRVDNEKSMATIITGNLGLGDASDSYLEDEQTKNEEDQEKIDHQGRSLTDDNSFVLLRRYTIS